MKNIEGIQYLSRFHTYLHQVKSSIDAVIKQENEYEQNFKRYSIKEIELKQKDDETPQETIERIEIVLDQIV